MTEVYRFETYVPKSHLKQVKDALSKAGAGKYGDKYDSCMWETLGQGQFRALKGANPFCGRIDEVHYEEEYKLEMIVQKDLINGVIEALKNTHPYEVPAYQYWTVFI